MDKQAWLRVESPIIFLSEAVLETWNERNRSHEYDTFIKEKLGLRNIRSNRRPFPYARETSSARSTSVEGAPLSVQNQLLANPPSQDTEDEIQSNQDTILIPSRSLESSPENTRAKPWRESLGDWDIPGQTEEEGDTIVVDGGESISE
jgi:hypothetical protein